MSDMIQELKPEWHVKVTHELPEQGENGVLYFLSDGLNSKVYIWIGWWAEIETASSEYQLAKHAWDIHFELAWPQIKEILDNGKDWTVEIKEV